MPFLVKNVKLEICSHRPKHRFVRDIKICKKFNSQCIAIVIQYFFLSSTTRVIIFFNRSSIYETPWAFLFSLNYCSLGSTVGAQGKSLLTAHTDESQAIELSLNFNLFKYRVATTLKTTDYLLSNLIIVKFLNLSAISLSYACR